MVDFAASIPSFWISPMIRGEPQVGLAHDILWISSRISLATTGGRQGLRTNFGILYDIRNTPFPFPEGEGPGEGSQFRVLSFSLTSYLHVQLSGASSTPAPIRATPTSCRTGAVPAPRSRKRMAKPSSCQVPATGERLR